MAMEERRPVGIPVSLLEKLEDLKFDMRKKSIHAVISELIDIRTKHIELARGITDAKQYS